MRHLVCFNFLPKRRISCPKGPRSHGFCGRTVAQAALNYVARSCLKSEVQQSFIPLSPHSWLRRIDSACLSQRLSTDSLLWRAGDQDVCQTAGRDSGRFGESARLRQRGDQDYRPPDLSPTVSAEHGAGPVALSALPSGDGSVEDLAPQIWGHL